MNRIITLFLFAMALGAPQRSLAQKDTSKVLTSGAVRYLMINPSTHDTSVQMVYFQPGKGAYAILNKADSIDFLSIYDFVQDSVFHLRMGKNPSKPYGMKLSETLKQSTKEAPLVGALQEKTKQILGFDCTAFEVKSVGVAKQMNISGWNTAQIQTQARPVMEETLIKLGMPLEMTIMVPVVSAKPVMIFQAISIESQVDSSIFVLPSKQ